MRLETEKQKWIFVLFVCLMIFNIMLFKQHEYICDAKKRMENHYTERVFKLEKQIHDMKMKV